MGPVKTNKEHSPPSDQGTTTFHEDKLLYATIMPSHPHMRLPTPSLLPLPPHHTHTCVYLLSPSSHYHPTTPTHASTYSLPPPTTSIHIRMVPLPPSPSSLSSLSRPTHMLNIHFSASTTVSNLLVSPLPSGVDDLPPDYSDELEVFSVLLLDQSTLESKQFYTTPAQPEHTRE